jgi:hypothetical protein
MKRGVEQYSLYNVLYLFHLGNGASMCALSAGRSVATTMGFTAVDGLPMGTRCGALDPGVLLFLRDQRRLGARALERLISDGRIQYYHRLVLALLPGSSSLCSSTSNRSGRGKTKSAANLPAPVIFSEVLLPPTPTAETSSWAVEFVRPDGLIVRFRDAFSTNDLVRLLRGPRCSQSSGEQYFLGMGQPRSKVLPQCRRSALRRRRGG